MDNSIGKTIKEKRIQKGLTQEELAEKMGVSPQAVSKWENDISYPDITILSSLARELGCTVDELLGNKKEEKIELVEKENVDISKLMLKIRILGGNQKDKVNVNVPVKLIEVLLSNDAVSSHLNIGGDKIKNIDFAALMQMIELGVMGKLVEIDSEDGDKVEIFVERIG